MAQVKVGSSEIPEIVKLVEQLFPGAKLDAVTTALAGLTIKSDTLLTRAVGQSTVELEITVTPD